VHVFRGGPGGPSATPWQSLSSPDGLDGFGCRLAGAADLDGDGYADLAVARVGQDFSGGVYVYKGGPGGFPKTTKRIDSPDYKPSRNGYSLAGVGDLDGDGYADLVAGEIDYSAMSGRIHIYRGGTDGVGNHRVTTIVSGDPSGLQFGATVAGAGDVDGDGYPDLVVGAPVVSTIKIAPRAHVYLGGAGGIGPGSKVIDLDGGGADGFASEVEGGGDLDGDGLCDVIVATSGGLRFYPSGANSALPVDAMGPLMNPRHMAVGGDLDGDGLADALILDGAGLQWLSFSQRGGASTAVVSTAPDGAVF
jgi:hypothetical protein